MKKMKKFFAILLALVMVMGMSVTTFATGGEAGTPNSNIEPIAGEPNNQNKVNVKITGFYRVDDKGDATTTPDLVKVTLYQVAKAVYDDDRSGFIRYTWNDGVEGFTKDAEVVFPKKSGSDDFNTLQTEKIITIANSLPESLIYNSQKEISVNNGEYETSVSAGIYVAMITGSSSDKKNYVYNPVLLTATYSAEDDGSVNLLGGSINISDAKYLNGTTSVAKRSTPSIDKKIEDGTTVDTTLTGTTHLPADTNLASTPSTNATASVGDMVKFSIKPKMPSYPKDATNKALAVSDRTTEGLTLYFDTLEIYLNSVGENTKLQKGTGTGTIPFTIKDTNKVVAYAKEVKEDNKVVGFNVTFEYNNLIENEITGATYQPILEYSARINDKAVVGVPGNINTTTLHYTNKPNTTSNYQPSTGDLPEGEDIQEKKDQETIFTYQIAFHKVGVDDKAGGLDNAIFGIYSDKACTTLIDVVKTNTSGYAVSRQVQKGDYYIKEIQAPTGYSLSDKVYKATAQWTTATTTITGTVTRTEYTTNTNEAKSPKQVGWLDKDNVFYAMDEKATVEATGKTLSAAYVKTEATTTTSSVKKDQSPGSGTVTDITEVDGGTGTVADIPNTKLAMLPSTGGIGTTIFTFGGCAIMIIAAGLYFATRRKSAK